MKRSKKVECDAMKAEIAMLKTRLLVAECEADHYKALAFGERLVDTMKALGNARMALTHLREGNETMAKLLTEMVKR